MKRAISPQKFTGYIQAGANQRAERSSIGALVFVRLAPTTATSRALSALTFSMKPLLFALALTGVPLMGGAFAAPATPVKPAAAPVPKAGAPATTATGVAAEVNGEKILLADLNRQVEDIKSSEPSLQTNSPAATQALANVRSQMLDDLIVRKLLSQEARRRKISSSPADIDALIEQTKKRFKTPADFDKWLATRGVSATQLRSVLSEEVAMDELTARVTSDVTVSDADIAQYYRNNPDDFTIQPAVKARHILLAVNPNASAADKDAVRKRAQNLIAQLKKGADFATLAKNNSDDKSNAGRGGELPVFERGMMVKAFEDAAFGAKAGDIVGPVETEYGMHIIKVDQVLPQKLVDLKDVKDDPRLKALILREKKQTQFDAFVAGLKASAKINRYV